MHDSRTSSVELENWTKLEKQYLLKYVVRWLPIIEMGKKKNVIYWAQVSLR